MLTTVALNQAQMHANRAKFVFRVFVIETIATLALFALGIWKIRPPNFSKIVDPYLRRGEKMIISKQASRLKVRGWDLFAWKTRQFLNFLNLKPVIGQKVNLQ